MKQWRPRDCGFSEFWRDYPLHFTTSKGDGAFLFEGNSCVSAEDTDVWMKCGSQPSTRGATRKAVDFMENNDAGREKSNGHKTTPSILELRSAIAEAAKLCGKPTGRYKPSLAQDHPAA